MNAGVPLSLSVVWHGRDCVRTIEDTLDSVFALTGVEIEILIEDGGSTDGTLDVLARRAAHDPRIKLEAQPIAADGERLLRGLRRAQGDAIVVCAGGNRLLAEAAKAALEEFRRSSAAALVCGVGDGTLDIVTLMFGRYRPSLQNALIRRSVLVDLGLDQDRWQTGCLEFDIWRRLATDEGWADFGPAIATSPPHVWLAIESVDDLQNSLMAYRAIAEELFSDTGFFVHLADRQQLMLESVANHLSLMREDWALPGDTAAFTIFESLQRVLAHELNCVDYTHSGNFQRSRSRIADFRQIVHSLPELQQPLPSPLDRLLERVGLRPKPPSPLTPMERTITAPLKTTVELPLIEFCRQTADLYAQIKDIYENRGQVEEAMKMWDRTGPLNDIWIDGFALQTAGKVPYITTDKVLAIHRLWVERHVGRSTHVQLPLAQPYRGDRKIRIGYHCSFMDSSHIRPLWTKVFAGHDRSAFDVFAYCPAPLPADMAAAFDAVRYLDSSEADPTSIRVGHMRTISDDRFMRMVQADQIDILIELSGFSHGHRLAAMARRCAPIQVMHMNHPFTSGVPNIDYFITDGTASPVDDSDFHTEQLVRLPCALFCFDYRDSNNPPIVDPPILKRSHVTFGSFSGGQKYNGALLELWSKVLHRVPNSKLRLQNGQMKNVDARRFIKARFEKFGIDAERIVTVPGVDPASLLKEYREVDICLDTWPYSGGLSIAEPLWQGVPVVGFYGQAWRDRYGASLLAAAGCSNLVAKNFDEYVDIAAELAADPERLRSLRHSLRDMCTTHGLNDSVGMARCLDAAYLEMMARFL